MVLCWVPSHIGIEGNEAADYAAKKALKRKFGAEKMPYTDVQPMAKEHMMKRWQNAWNNERDNKLRAIVPNMKRSFRHDNLTRCEQVVLTRLRTGHTKLTHGHLLRGELPPVCRRCNTPLSVKHLMLHCQATMASRQKHLKNAQSMNSVFHNTGKAGLLDFLREAEIYDKI